MFPKNHDKTALIFDDNPIDYKTLLNNIAAYAAGFSLGAAERAVLYSENRPEWIYAFYAVWVQQGICVPVDASLPTPDLAYVVEDCQPAVLFCSEAKAGLVSKAVREMKKPPQIIIFERFTQTVLPYAGRLASGLTDQLQNPAVILYTSGTTGRPKGVVLSYDNLLTNIEVVQTKGYVSGGDRLFSILPFHHILPLQSSVVAPFHLGATVIMISGLDQRDIMHALQTHHPTVMIGVPRLYERFRQSIMDQIRKNMVARWLFGLAALIKHLGFSRLLFAKVQRAFGGQLRICVSGGAKLDLKVARDLWALGFKMLEGYGTTETAPLIALNPEHKIKLGSVGLPIPANQVKLVEGEIAVKGRNVMQGYYRREAATRQVLRDGWYYTGDLGEQDEDGYLYMLGRKDELIILPSGKNVAPENIEIRLQEMSPLVREAAVLLADGRLTALIYSDSDAPETLEIIKSGVIEPYNREVTEDKKIRSVRLVREPFQRTRLGKLRRFTLAGLLRDPQAGASVKKASPFPEYRILENFLVKLKSIPVSPDDHLELDLGLDSLDRAELAAFAEKNFGLALMPEALKETGTVAKLADYLRHQKTKLQDEEVGWHEILAKAPALGSGKPIKIRFRKILQKIVNAYFDIECSGLENLRSEPFILAANHLSYLDAPVITAVLPGRILERTCMVMRRGFMVSLLAGVFSRGNLIRVDAEADLKGSLHRIAGFLKTGHNILIFPEGHRSRDGHMAGFKKTFAILGHELHVPVIPVVIHGTYSLMPYGKFWPHRGKISVKFLPPISPKGNYIEFTDQVEAAIRARVEAMPV